MKPEQTLELIPAAALLERVRALRARGAPAGANLRHRAAGPL